MTTLSTRLNPVYPTPQALLDGMKTDRLAVYKKIVERYGVQECQCAEYNREIVSTRQMLEDSFIEEFTALHPDKNQPIRLTSVGSGDCFEELVLISLLLNEGYKDIHFTLFDLNYDNEPGNKPVRELQRIIEEELHAEKQVKIEFAVDFEDYLQNPRAVKDPDAFFFIDLFKAVHGSVLSNITSKTISKSSHYSDQTLFTYSYFSPLFNLAHTLVCMSKVNLLYNSEMARKRVSEDLILMTNKNVQLALQEKK